MTDDEDKLGAIYTAEEVAGQLRITRRALIKFARDIGACSRVGRTYLFSAQDKLDIWQGLRAEPIRYHGRAVHVPAHQSPLNVSRSLQALLAKKSKGSAKKADAGLSAHEKRQRLRREREARVARMKSFQPKRMDE
ncbi:hypothetical protein [Allomesorhizobium alhagi]|uniref:Uncharacterized protein n=1 Tax=Mesorhizobium alhagi CCNWXJ12-2 TaxID=1107882 RepID=H0HR16_9HYPH|nr:hypothetical protein [Mesorhizobium alhagi]EHK56796.1 hypothetical protein MAXJ12_12996 [Mesorhizobium alhagi CCNWXJ12-2]